jgi:hypothetical protein
MDIDGVVAEFDRLSSLAATDAREMSSIASKLAQAYAVIRKAYARLAKDLATIRMDELISIIDEEDDADPGWRVYEWNTQPDIWAALQAFTIYGDGYEYKHYASHEAAIADYHRAFEEVYRSLV